MGKLRIHRGEDIGERLNDPPGGLVFDETDVWWKGRASAILTARETLGEAACDAHQVAGSSMDVGAALRAARPSS